MAKEFKQAMIDRRSYYGITNETTIPKEQILEIINDSVRYVPSAFNSQSQRVAVCFDENHQKLWSIVMETLRARVPASEFHLTEEKISRFAAAYGTILYFDDTSVTKDLARRFPAYKENFSIWADQSNGMLQFAIWSQLEAEGLGANLQHYNPIIDDQIKKEFDIPKSWKLLAQMPFGKPIAEPEVNEKEMKPIESRVIFL